MNVRIIGRKCTPRESFKERVDQKLSKIDKFFKDDAEAKVTVTVEKNSQIVEITVMSGGMIFRAEESADNMLDALDRAESSLVRQIRKNKTKVEKKLRSGAFDNFTSEEPVPDEAIYEVIRNKKVLLKPQLVDEAILQMNMLGHQFYMFLDAETNKISVVYRRKDGGYGLIEPERE